MFIFLFLMASGAVVGYRFRCVSKIHKVTSLIQVVICFLLFILGFSIGTNRLIMDNLKYFCEQAALIAGLSILGSSVAALLVYQLFFKKGGDYEGSSGFSVGMCFRCVLSCGF